MGGYGHIDICGGSAIRLNVHDNGVAYVSDVSMNLMEGRGQSKSHVIGGAINEVRMWDDGQLFIYGIGFNYGYGPIPDIAGNLQGTLLTGDTVDLDFSVYSPTASIILAEFIPGDANGDNFVGSDDLVAVLSGWGQSGASRQQGDLTGDGFVGSDDYVEVLTFWGDGFPPAEPTPEPATLGLLLVGGLAMLRRRVR